MITALFDLDGTVTDPGVGITNSVMYALRRFGIEPPERKELYCFIGPPLRESFSKYFGLSDSDAEKAVGYYREYYRPKGIFECTLYDGILDTFEKLTAAGVKVALATAKPEVFAEKIAAHFGFDKYMSLISGASLDASRDDKAVIIARALESLPGADKSLSYMTGDRAYDIDGGKKNGLLTVAALYGYGTEKELSHADFKADTAYDIANIILK